MAPFPMFFFLIPKIITTSAEISAEDYLSMPPVFHMDDYDRCMLHGDDALYCGIVLKLSPENPESPSKVWKIIQDLSSNEKNYRHDYVRYRICVTDLLPNITKEIFIDDEKIKQTVETYYNEKYRVSELISEMVYLKCETQEPAFYPDIFDTVFSVFVYAYAAILICATLYDIHISGKSDEEYEKAKETTLAKFVSTLSLKQNWNRLMSVDLHTKDMKALRCIQGFRLFTTIKIILIHSISINQFQFVSNTYDVERKWTQNSISDTTYLMQTFFMVSSMLQCYSFLVELEKGEKVTLKYFIKRFAKRYVRLTPVLFFSVLYLCTWMIHYVRGPHWNDNMGYQHEICRKNGWANVLYVNNLLPMKMMCLPHTWFLAVNTQFYVISFFILYLIWKYPRKVTHIFGCLILAHFVIVSSLIYLYNLGHMFQQTSLEPDVLSDQDAPNFWHHVSLWSNSAGMISGLICGYIFYTNRKKNIRIKTIYTPLYWMLSFGLCDMADSLDNSFINYNNPLYSAMYGGVRRFLFCSGQGIFLLGMIYGQGWILKWLHETTPVYILGRLTYSAYITHLFVILFRVGRNRTLFRFVNLGTIFEGIFVDLPMSFAVALFMTLFVEMPVIELEKWLTATSKSGQDKELKKIK